MKIAISAGHNVYNAGYFDNGSSFKDLKEATITKETVSILINMLKYQGHTVKDVTPYNGWFRNSREAHEERARRVNKGSYDLYLDIHVNAGGGTGPEVLLNAKNNVSYSYGRKIVNSIAAKTGLRNRGVKNKLNFWSIKMVKCPAIIVEGGFIDSPDGGDMKVLTPKLYAESIASVFGDVVEGVKMMPTERDYSINDKEYKYNSINLDGTIYAPVSELAENLGFDVSSKGNKALINTRKEIAEVNEEGVYINVVKVNKDTNYIKLEDLVKLGIIETDWMDKKVIINTKARD